MTGSALADLAVGVVILGLLIYRQLKVRPVRARARITLILAVLGVSQVASFLSGHHADPVTVASLAGSLVLAAFFAKVRAATVRVWLRDGQAWSQGSWLTALLWAAAFAVHLGYDSLLDMSTAERGVGSASSLLYLAVSLAVQRVIIRGRARRLPSSPAAMLAHDGLPR